MRDKLENDQSLFDKNFNLYVLFSDDADLFYKFGIDKSLDENERRLNDQEILWLENFNLLVSKENLQQIYLQNGDIREPEIAGVLGAVIGSLYTILITLIISFSIGVLAAIYLESFAAKTELLILLS